MKALFEILPDVTDTVNYKLIGEISSEGFSYVVKNELDNSFLGVGVFQYDKHYTPGGFPIALQMLFQQHELLSNDFKKVQIVYSLTESVLIPFSLYNKEQNKEVIDLVHGDANHDAIILTEKINAHDLYNAYRVPTAIRKVVEEQYPYCNESHQYTAVLKQTAPGKDELSAIFYDQKMVVSLFKNDQYQLINSYQFRTAEDVSFTLLNICHQFKAENIEIKLGGLIEENSALYRDIYKYFDTISFATNSPDGVYPEKINKYPSQYFSHIFAFDSCA